MFFLKYTLCCWLNYWSMEKQRHWKIDWICLFRQANRKLLGCLQLQLPDAASGAVTAKILRAINSSGAVKDHIFWAPTASVHFQFTTCVRHWWQLPYQPRTWPALALSSFFYLVCKSDRFLMYVKKFFFFKVKWLKFIP